ncbi:MAG: sodium ion-translocating decarboxylase subunit beta [Clostridia bacterium]|nr:sodium ion-translocating decarboxylase subunit beta [Clostridia bacterium]
MSEIIDSLSTFLQGTGIAQLMEQPDWWKTLVMFVIVGALVYLAIVKQYEPLLLLPIAIGMLLTNIPGANIYHPDLFIKLDGSDINFSEILHDGGFLDLLYIGVKLGIYPCLIFIGIGAMTDFTPLIANPKSLLIGAGAQLGVFVAFSVALISGFFTPEQAAAIGIIGGADGPTAITVAKELAPELLGAIAIAAYSYMALIPGIQPPLMNLLTTKKERAIRMTTLREVSKVEKVIFPVLVTAVVGLIVPDALVLIGCLMFGNLLNVCGVTDRLSKTAQNELINIVTILLGVSVGATATAANFLKLETLLIIGCGLAAFGVSTCGGLITAKIMNVITGGKINPLIGSAGVSAVPMAARVSQKVGSREDPTNFLLMHAMGPNVAGVIGSAVAAGVFLSWFR